MNKSSDELPSATEFPVSEPPASDRNHLHALTGLRIFAALAVYFSHLGAPSGVPAFVDTLFRSGYYGVTFFFTLSGFVLAINYFDALKRPTAYGLWTYGVARFARVYPLYLLVLIYMIAKALGSGNSIGLGWIAHVLALQAWHPNRDFAFSYNGPGWSIGVEFFLYATLPLLIPVIARLDRGIRWLMVAVGVIATVMITIAVLFSIAGLGDLPSTDPSSAHRWLYRTPLFRLGDFALGILAARLFQLMRGDTHSERLGGVLILAALLATAFFATRKEFLESVASWDVAYALPAFALLLGLALAPSNIVARFLALPVIVLFGEASYAFYLVHAPALAAFAPSGVTNNIIALKVVLQVFKLAIIMALAVGLHIIIEKPARKWLRRLFVRDVPSTDLTSRMTKPTQGQLLDT